MAQNWDEETGTEEDNLKVVQDMPCKRSTSIPAVQTTIQRVACEQAN
jgi:hypothetical protein